MTRNRILGLIWATFAVLGIFSFGYGAGFNEGQKDEVIEVTTEDGRTIKLEANQFFFADPGTTVEYRVMRQPRSGTDWHFYWGDKPDEWHVTGTTGGSFTVPEDLDNDGTVRIDFAGIRG